MSRVIFEKPNESKQPAPGVYRWYYVDEGEKIPFYVGQAGGKTVGHVRLPSTLGRGVSEMQRASFSGDKGRSLDTDFVVGTMIMYLREKGYDCTWEHISDDPKQEREFCDKPPVLQNKDGSIRKEFKLREHEGCWKGNTRVKEAEQRLSKTFENALRLRMQQDNG